MQTTIYLSNRRVFILQGRAGRHTSRVKRILYQDLQRDCLVGGVIVDAAALTAELQDLWNSNRLPHRGVHLVVGSSQFLVRLLQAPRLNQADTLKIVQRDFSDTNRPEDVIDYMQLRPREGEQASSLLCCSVPRELLRSYRELFAAIGVKLASISSETACIAKLVEALPELEGKTCILLNLDGDNLLGVLVEDGRFKYASRARLLHDTETAERAAEVTQTVSGLIQFQIADRRGPRINSVYFCSYPEGDYLACQAGIQAMGLEIDQLPDSQRISLRRAGTRLRDCLLPIGDFISR